MLLPPPLLVGVAVCIQVQTGTQVRKGFDLVRVGNFSEDPSGLQVAGRLLVLLLACKLASC